VVGLIEREGDQSLEYSLTELGGDDGIEVAGEAACEWEGHFCDCCWEDGGFP